MRILILHSRYRSGPASGENRVVEDEAVLLAEGGHAVEVLDPSVGDPAGLDLLRTGARVVWSRKMSAETRSRVRRFKPDVVHVHNLFPALSPAVIRAIDDQIPIVMTLHNYRLHCLPGTFLRDGRICEDCLARTPWPGVVHGCYQSSVPASVALATSLSLHRKLGTFDRVRLFVAISEFVRAKSIQGGLPADRIVVKRHFVWPSKQREGAGEYFLYLGRLSPEKGVTTLVQAWKEITATLLIVGGGPEERTLRDAAPSNVEFLPTVSPERAQSLIVSARAILVPSLWHEPAGRVVLEGYSAGVPTLAAETGGLSEVVDEGVTGLLLPPRDAAAWAQGVRRLLIDAESTRMGKGAQRLWETDYSTGPGLANLEGVYEAAINS